ncbi:MAG: leucyl aminopeptidase [Pseudomonadota bacterium]
MKIQLKTSSLLAIAADCIVVATWGNQQLSANAQTLNNHLKGALTAFLKKTTQLENTCDSAFFTLREKELNASQLLLVNLGNKKEFTLEIFKKAIDKVAATLETIRCKSVCFAFDDVSPNDSTTGQCIRATAIALQQATYRFETYKSKPKTSALSQVIFFADKSQKNLDDATKQAEAIIAGMDLTMDLANCPPNVCHPGYLAKQADQLAKKYASLTVKTLNEAALKKLGAGALLSVGNGSPHKSKMILIEYRGAAKTQQPHILVGKGITFDTGGNNLKNFDGMLGMKYDMCGAATVFGVIKTVVELKLKINVVGIIATAENMPGGEATRPEDIVTSLSGQTIEILNTDAEGRLVLCDALTYAERYNPKSVIDIATLTGAIITCLGDINSGLFSNNDKLAEQIQQAATTTQDGVWRLPISSAYDAMINSNFADIKNIGGAAAGSITAACFLARFTKKYPWAHLDVAGTASVKAGMNRKATGRPVPLLVEYLLQQR